jgi:antitoxin (DNA-binding transcriptional repressor) of toxin-antitoxin stability system
MGVKSLNVSEFRKNALDLLEHLPPEGVLITKRGKPLAKVVPMRSNIADLIGSMKGKLQIKGDIFSTGIRWEAEEGKIDGEPIP